MATPAVGSTVYNYNNQPYIYTGYIDMTGNPISLQLAQVMSGNSAQPNPKFIDPHNEAGNAVVTGTGKVLAPPVIPPGSDTIPPSMLPNGTAWQYQPGATVTPTGIVTPPPPAPTGDVIGKIPNDFPVGSNQQANISLSGNPILILALIALGLMVID